MEGLLKRRNWKVILSSKVWDGAKLLEGRFVLATKN